MRKSGDKMNTILCFGDSLAYGAWDPEGGWVARLRKELEEKGDWLVYNLGIDGDTTRQLLERIHDEIKRRLGSLEGDRLIIIIQIGKNDSMIWMDSGENVIPLPEFKENMMLIISLCKRFTKNVLVVGPGKVDESKTCPISWDPSRGYKNKEIKKYLEALRGVVGKLGVRFLDVLDKLDKSDLAEDGLHWNEKGQKKIKNLVLEAVTGLLEEKKITGF